MQEHIQSTGELRSLSLAQIGGKTLRILGLISVVLVGLWLWVVWTNTKHTHLERTRMVSSLVAGYADNYFNLIAENMRELGDDLAHADVMRNPKVALRFLQRFKSTHPALLDPTIILPDGRVLARAEPPSAGVLPTALSGNEGRADFEYSLKTRGLTITRAQFSKLAGQWIIPMRYAVRNPDGAVAFLVQTGIRLDRQQGLWRDFQLGDNAYVELLRDDGYLISRFPDDAQSSDIYRKKTHAALVEAIERHVDSGSIEGVVTGEKRIGGYARLRNYPLYAALSFPQSTVTRVWWRGVQMPLYLIAGVLLGVMVVYWIGSRRFAARMLLIQARLEHAGGARNTVLPSSGVREIDKLCEALAQSQAKLWEAAQDREKMLLSAARGGTYAVDLRAGTVAAADERFLEMLGTEAGAVIGHPWVDFVAEDTDTRRFVESQGQNVVQQIVKFRGADQCSLWLSIAEYQATADDGKAMRYGLAIDVTERERLLDRLRHQSERFHALWELSTNRIKPEDEKLLSMLSLGLSSLGAQAAAISEAAQGEIRIRHVVGPLGLLKEGQRLHPDDPFFVSSAGGNDLEFVRDLGVQKSFHDHLLVQAMGVHAFATLPIWIGKQPYGSLTLLWTKPFPARLDEDDKTFVRLLASWFGQTFLQRKQRDELEEMAMTDSLTRLPNRRAAEQRFAQECSRATREGERFSIAICDLDHFKLVNDAHGHDTGDAVLRHAAKIMRRTLREGDWVARWGGEEFIVFLHHSTAEDAQVAMERLRLAIGSEPFVTSQGILRLTASIGIGLWHGGDISPVVAEADRCLYQAKASGRDRIVMSEAGGSQRSA
jgi:diguanylate cyclase (GGDEF)-like protein